MAVADLIGSEYLGDWCNSKTNAQDDCSIDSQRRIWRFLGHRVARGDLEVN